MSDLGTGQAPPPDAAATVARQAYVPPRIEWEQEFVALTAASDPNCVPGRDPACTP